MRIYSNCFDSTSFDLSRRQFLKALIAMGGLSAFAARLGKSMVYGETIWQEPVWVLSLKDDAIRYPSGMAVPYGMPGSVMKLVAATALLEDRLMTPEVQLECRGTLRLGSHIFRCQQAHGQMNIQKAIAVSCNLFFAQAAERLSVRRFLAYAKLFQLHQPVTGRDQFLFPQKVSNGQPSQPYVLGLSKDMQPNALQLLRMAGLVAQRSAPGIQETTWHILQNGMRQAATVGTAARLDPANQMHIAAKTGTVPHGHTFQSWLIGYFPFEKPQYAFCVRSLAGTASDAAVPQARRVLLNRKWH